MASRLDRAIAGGVQYLRSMLGSRPGWRDFVLPDGTVGSTECVSAFVAAQLGPVPEGRDLAVTVTRALLAHPHHDGGWGYRADVPADSDSTAWVLIAAAESGVAPPDRTAQRAAAFITGHQRDDGGFATYGDDARAALTPADQPGWFEPEVSVTASAVIALTGSGGLEPERLRTARRYLAERGRAGLWASSWWSGFGYPTDLVLQALGPDLRAETRARTELALVERHRPGGGWGNTEHGPDNAFSTAFALRTLLAGASPPARWPAVADGLRHLAATGTWAGAEMLAPGAAPDGGDLALRDGGVISTAAVVRTLHEARRRLIADRSGVALHHRARR